jgi:hypothetical protein
MYVRKRFGVEIRSYGIQEENELKNGLLKIFTTHSEHKQLFCFHEVEGIAI